MENIKKHFENIQKLDRDWVRIFKDGDKKSKNNSELIDEYEILFGELRSKYKQEEQEKEILKICSSYIEKEDAEWLLGRVKKSLEPYFAFKFLRNWQSEDIERCERFIKYVFENVVIRLEPECISDYCNQEQITNSEFVRAAKILDGLVAYYIKRHLTPKAIIEDLEDETDMKKELCEYVSKMIEDNYMKLQLNYIIDTIGENN